MGNKYIHNTHIAPITARVRKADGTDDLVKMFLPEQIDGTTGRVISTGYTLLTDEEYEKLSEGSRTFTHYRDKLKLLVVCDDVPPEAKTPTEALIDARRESRAAKTRIAERDAEIEKLKSRVLEAEDAYKRLASASLDEEKIKSFNDKIASLEAAAAEAAKQRDELKEENEKLKAADGKAGKGGKGKEFS